MNEDMYVTVRIDVNLHEGEHYYYGKNRAETDNSFTLPLTVYNAVNYSEIITEMVKATIYKYENPKEEDNED